MLDNVKILYADSDKFMLEAFNYMIARYGWSADIAYNATQLVEMVNENCGGSDQHCYDAIITAVSFFNPGSEGTITGVTAAKMIRKVRRDVPIIFLSAHNNSLIREEVRRVDAEFILKPIDTTFLFERIEELIIWHRATRDNKYQGKDRRSLSINKTLNFRRSTDRKIEISHILQEVTNERR